MGCLKLSSAYYEINTCRTYKELPSHISYYPVVAIRAFQHAQQQSRKPYCTAADVGHLTFLLPCCCHQGLSKCTTAVKEALLYRSPYGPSYILTTLLLPPGPFNIHNSSQGSLIVLQPMWAISHFHSISL